MADSADKTDLIISEAFPAAVGEQAGDAPAKAERFLRLKEALDALLFGVEEKINNASIFEDPELVSSIHTLWCRYMRIPEAEVDVEGSLGCIEYIRKFSGTLEQGAAALTNSIGSSDEGTANVNRAVEYAERIAYVCAPVFPDATNEGPNHSGVGGGPLDGTVRSSDFEAALV